MQLVGGEGELALMQCSSQELETYFSRHPKQRQVRLGDAGQN